ncbi:hypothetical protein ABZW18_21270 [Streptomyces sp. NPDC004647]|uniref:zinc finger domain-containing protein n=1 Tax=Streptomyces sp. NPDC004647 TaxID=3154671 RepID=UPI0033B8E44E
MAEKVLLIDCERCEAGSGEQCRTVNGWAADQPHRVRQKEAEPRGDARLGYVGDKSTPNRTNCI